MKVLFSIAAGLTLALGLAWLFVPEGMLSSWGVEADPATVYMGRRYGGQFFGYAAILWLTRRSPASEARTSILTGAAVVTTVLAIVSVAGAITGVVGPAVWIAAAVESLLAAGFAFYLIRARA
jgi:hypothetical protein